MTKEIIENLREREKELNCLYKVHKILRDEESPMDVVLRQLVSEIPKGWQFPGICMAKIEYDDIIANTPDFFQTKWVQKSDIVVEGSKVGTIKVFYNNNISKKHRDFLPEEQQLLNTIRHEVSQHIFNRKLKETISYIHDNKSDSLEHNNLLKPRTDEHWKWRYHVAQIIAEKTDFEYYGIKSMYLIGSVKEATARAASDLDLLVEFDGGTDQEKLLKSYMKGWSLSLAQLNLNKTGVDVEDGLIDLHIVTPETLKNKEDSFAAMIGSHDNSARLLKKRSS